MADLSNASSATLAEITIGLLSVPRVIEGTPSPVQSLASYVATYGGGLNLAVVMTLLGYSPVLAERVDQRAQSMPREVLARMAAFLRRPFSELAWASGEHIVDASAVGVGRVFR